MDDLQPSYGQPLPRENWDYALSTTRAQVEELSSRVEQLEHRLAQANFQVSQASKRPNLGIRIFLYSAGILLVFMAIILLVQSFGWLPTIARTTIWALVLLAIGAGILAGIRSR